MLGELVGEVMTADEQAGELLRQREDDHSDDPHQATSALQNVCDSVELTIRFSPEPFHSRWLKKSRFLHMTLAVSSSGLLSRKNASVQPATGALVRHEFGQAEKRDTNQPVTCNSKCT